MFFFDRSIHYSRCPSPAGWTVLLCEDDCLVVWIFRRFIVHASFRIFDGIDDRIWCLSWLHSIRGIKKVVVFAHQLDITIEFSSRRCLWLILIPTCIGIHERGNHRLKGIFYQLPIFPPFLPRKKITPSRVTCHVTTHLGASSAWRERGKRGKLEDDDEVPELNLQPPSSNLSQRQSL